ncbi:MAG: helicase [Planctomycetota bacterium]|nr:MAG: helicase [Planctomycetota bacterium]
MRGARGPRPRLDRTRSPSPRRPGRALRRHAGDRPAAPDRRLLRPRRGAARRHPRSAPARSGHPGPAGGRTGGRRRPRGVPPGPSGRRSDPLGGSGAPPYHGGLPFRFRRPGMEGASSGSPAAGLSDSAPPLILQSDLTIVLETAHPRFEEMRDGLLPFAELVKSPEYLHTYRVSPISIWNAAATGLTARRVLGFLRQNARYGVPPNFEAEIKAWFGRCGLFRLERDGDDGLVLRCGRPRVLKEVRHDPALAALLADPDLDQGLARVAPAHRGLVKERLVKLGYPVEDAAGYVDGAALAIRLREERAAGGPFSLRPYQVEAVEAFHRGGSELGGSGVIVLPCGAGKTVVGMAAMAAVGAHTLVLTPNTVALRQWREELLDKTDLDPEQIGEYSGEAKEIRPVTLTTYQILTYRRSKDEDFLHFDLFARGDWGLIVYDEVHLLPAPVFRATAEIQARRRLGLTATLVREDGKEDEVFSLIGPKRYDAPWKDLERRGYIATVRCVEVRVPFDSEQRAAYLALSRRSRYRAAAENPRKTPALRHLLERHAGEQILIIGQYLDQLHALQKELGVPLITGRTPTAEREQLYQAFREGREKILLVSKVGNFAIDLPDANVAIQISGTFGSRQEEAQRLGRILRPKADGSTAWFYSLVTEATLDQEYGEKRQRFLTEQGYSYDIQAAEALVEARP